jgi:hypothetical protein
MCPMARLRSRTGIVQFQHATPCTPEAAVRRPAHTTGAEVPREWGVFRILFRNDRALSEVRSANSVGEGIGPLRRPATTVQRSGVRPIEAA